MGFTSKEFAEMHFYYGLAQGNAQEAAKLYRDQLIRRGGTQPENYPGHKTFIRVHNAYVEGRMPSASATEILEGPEKVNAVLSEVQHTSLKQE